MKIAIVGAGAMGSLFGGFLASAGFAPTLIDVNARHVNAIREDGLRLKIGDSEKRVEVAATTDPGEVGPVDLIVLFCKYLHTADAIRAAAPMIASHTLVWTLQNGLGNVELIARQVPPERIAKGLTSMTAVSDGAGAVSTNFKGTSETFMWPVAGEPGDGHREAVEVFTAAGLPAFLDPDIDYRIWRKLSINASLTIVSAAVNVGIGPVGESDAGQRLLRAVTAEVVAVAQAAGVPLQFEDAFGYVEELRQKAFGHVGSTTMDLQAGNASEVDALSGAVVREGARLGVPTPVNATIADMVRLIEATRKQRLEPGI